METNKDEAERAFELGKRYEGEGRILDFLQFRLTCKAILNVHSNIIDYRCDYILLHLLNPQLRN